MFSLVISWSSRFHLLKTWLFKKEPVSIVQEASWVPEPSRRLWKYSPPPGFDPWTVQFVARFCTEYATPAHKEDKGSDKIQEFEKLTWDVPYNEVHWIERLVEALLLLRWDECEREQ
jgi:hypothetical protein